MFLFLSCLSWLRIMRKVSLIGMLKNRGMKYLCYSIIDTQANYTRISAQSYTTLISVQVLNQSKTYLHCYRNSYNLALVLFFYSSGIGPLLDISKVQVML